MKYTPWFIVQHTMQVEGRSNSNDVLTNVGCYPGFSCWNTILSKNNLQYIHSALLSIDFNDQKVITLQDYNAYRISTPKALARWASYVVAKGPHNIDYSMGSIRPDRVCKNNFGEILGRWVTYRNLKHEV